MLLTRPARQSRWWRRRRGANNSDNDSDSDSDWAGPAELLVEAQAGVRELEDLLRRWELGRLLSGKYDR